MSNEAAERLRKYLALNVPEDEALSDLDDALAAERRAMAKRIDERVSKVVDDFGSCPFMTLLAILDEEAAR